MMKKPLFVALTLIAVAGPAAAQSPAAPQSPAPQQPPAAAPEPKTATGQSGLNLKLDNAARFSETTGGTADTLPSLGADARTLRRDPQTVERAPRPYPKSSDQVDR